MSDEIISKTLRVSQEMFGDPTTKGYHVIEKPNVKMVIIDEYSEVPADLYRAIMACAPTPDLVPVRVESLE